MNTSAWPLYPSPYLESLYAAHEPDADQLAREMERSIRFEKLSRGFSDVGRGEVVFGMLIGVLSAHGAET